MERMRIPMANAWAAESAGFSLAEVGMPVGTYRFIDTRKFVTTVQFSYRGPPPENYVDHIDMLPGTDYWMKFNEGTNGTVTPLQGKFENHPGPLLMGDQIGASAPGSYRIVMN